MPPETGSSEENDPSTVVPSSEQEERSDRYEALAEQTGLQDEGQVQKVRRRLRYSYFSAYEYRRRRRRLRMRAKRLRARRMRLRVGYSERVSEGPGPVHRRIRLSKARRKARPPRHATRHLAGHRKRRGGRHRADAYASWLSARHDALHEWNEHANARGPQLSLWRRLVLAVILVLVLELALLGAVTLVVTVLCSMTRCLTVVSVSPDRTSVSAVSSPVTVTVKVAPAGAAVTRAGARGWLTDPVMTAVQGRVAAGQMTEIAVTRSLPTSRTVPVKVAALPRAAVLAGIWRSTVEPQEGDPTQADELPVVVANATNWLRAISLGVAVLCATLAGLRWSFAREPSDVERARSSLGAACAGFAIALLAPQIMSILTNILGVSYG